MVVLVVLSSGRSGRRRQNYRRSRRAARVAGRAQSGGVAFSSPFLAWRRGSFLQVAAGGRQPGEHLVDRQRQPRQDVGAVQGILFREHVPANRVPPAVSQTPPPNPLPCEERGSKPDTSLLLPLSVAGRGLGGGVCDTACASHSCLDRPSTPFSSSAPCFPSRSPKIEMSRARPRCAPSPRIRSPERRRGE